MLVEPVISFKKSIEMAIKKNFFIVVLITSHTTGRIKESLNMPYGVGKSSLALWISYQFNDKDWDKVFENLAYYPSEILDLLEPGKPRKNVIVWDDVQMTAPASNTVPKEIRQIAAYTTTSRPEVSCLVMTAPNINSIAAPLRRIVLYEIIVPKRGVFEVQHYVFRKDFKHNPFRDIPRAVYVEEGTFPPLPQDMYERYEAWKEGEKKRLYGVLQRKTRRYEGVPKGEVKVTNKDLVPTVEAARMLDISYDTLMKWIRNRKIAAIKEDGKWYVPRQVIEEMTG